MKQTVAVKAGLALTDFAEGKITFPPTYKYLIGTNEFDLRYLLMISVSYTLSEPPSKRSPAYTDRIVYRQQSPVSVEQHCYSVGSLLLSDHKPIFSLFSISYS